MAFAICDRLNLGTSEKKKYISSINERVRPKNFEKFQLQQQAYDLVANPIHIALLTLLECQDFFYDANWIGHRLGRSKLEINEAIALLKLHGLVHENKDSLKASHRQGIQTSDEIYNKALRQSHIAQLQHAIKCLDKVPIEARDFISEFMAIDPSKLPQAKRLAREFRGKLAHLLETGERKEVYQLSIQMVPLTIINEEKEK